MYYIDKGLKILFIRNVKIQIHPSGQYSDYIALDSIQTKISEYYLKRLTIRDPCPLSRYIWLFVRIGSCTTPIVMHYGKSTDSSTYQYHAP